MGRESPRPILRHEPEPDIARPAFDLIYRSSIAYLHGMLRRMGVASRDREDVAHEVFLVVQRRLADYDPSLKLRAWLAGIAWHVARRWKERAHNQRLELGMSDDEQEQAVDASPDPEQAVSAAEVEVQLRELTNALLQTVPEERRIVLIMHDLDAIGMPDIVRALGISPNTGWDRLRRARHDFKAAVLRLNEKDRDALGASGIRPIPLLAIPLDPGAMFEHLRYVPDVPAGLEERLWARLQSSDHAVPRDAREDGSTDAGPSAKPRTAPAVVAAGTALAGLTGAKLAAWSAFVFLLGGGVGVLVYASAFANRAGEPVPAVAHDSAALASAPTETSLVVVSPPTPTVTAEPATAAGEAASARIENGEADTDGALMKRAGAALSTGKAASALTLMQRHAQKYPRSARGQERDALTIQALALFPGKRAEALARAAQFRQSFPDSVFVPSIDAALGVVNAAP